MKGMKETAANVAASAKSGMEKTKATMQEKVLFFFISLWISKYVVVFTIRFIKDDRSSIYVVVVYV